MASLLSKRDVEMIEFDMEAKVNEDLEKIHAERAAYNQSCKYFYKGVCQKGEGCKYRHHHGEKSVVCKHWLRGLCKKNDLCEFLHEYDLLKMPPCYFFNTYQECSNPDCPFLHIDPENRIKDCQWYARGFCKHGPNCRNRHLRTEACPDYFAGFCVLGPTCPLKHPKFALPTTDATGAKKIPMVSTCHICKEPDHTSAFCPKRDDKAFNPRGYRSLQDVLCFKCQEKGHYADRCPNSKKRGPPSSFGEMGGNKQYRGEQQ